MKAGLPLKDGVLAETVNVSSVVYQVISAGNKGYATLHELSTIYSLEDALNLIEVHQVSEYNKRLIEEIANGNSN
ncbi:hypothetical protein [Photorhabdus luminescens]|uniref:hypothetical protein n=1 Tax=Photorhabdus luminescens TaxID=29488 RepID=UPI001C405C56|nr:hypothetical protein [Photorhabdus luminescens]